MKPPVSPVSRPLAAALALGLCLMLDTGCGGRHTATRPASSLSEQDHYVLDRYEEIRAALANDDLRIARTAAGTLSLALKPADSKMPAPALLAEAEQISVAPALDRARQIFKKLSAKVVPLADGVEGYYVMTCAMPSCGDWVQRTNVANNPYMGKTMQDYGELRK